MSAQIKKTRLNYVRRGGKILFFFFFKRIKAIHSLPELIQNWKAYIVLLWEYFCLNWNSQPDFFSFIIKSSITMQRSLFSIGSSRNFCTVCWRHSNTTVTGNHIKNLHLNKCWTSASASCYLCLANFKDTSRCYAGLQPRVNKNKGPVTPCLKKSPM